MTRKKTLDSLFNHIIDQYKLKKCSSLDSFQNFLKQIGSPHLHLPPVVHIAGSNGKGSVLAFLRSMLQTAGYKVHSYTSPHLISANERISLEGAPIAEQDFCDLLDEVAKASLKQSVSFFELVTTAAFLAFSRRPADILLLEAGLGGRLDATNVIPSPLCCVITSLGLEHTEFLGGTLGEIAQEKAGIIKPQRPVITLHQDPEAMKVIRAAALSCDAPFYEAKIRDELKTIKLGLAGLHQTSNASLALAILDILPCFKVSRQDRIKGLETASWPGRLQRLDQQKWGLPDDCELWIDGAHNSHAAAQIAASFKGWEPRPLFLIVALQKSKDAIGFFRPFQDLNPEIQALSLKDLGNFFSAEELSKTAQNLGVKAEPCHNIAQAIGHIKTSLKTQPTPSRILVCGSLYLVGLMLGPTDFQDSGTTCPLSSSPYPTLRSG